MLTLRNKRMQPQAKQWPPGASKARHIPYGGSSAQLTVALGCSDTEQNPEVGERPLLPAVFATQFGDQGLTGKAHILSFPIDNVKLCVRSHHHSRGRDRMLSKLTESPTHGQPRLQSKLCEKPSKIKNDTHTKTT